MLTISHVQATFRHPNRGSYPELANLTAEQIYDGKMGPGGLYLAANMARALHLEPGHIVLDLGCGRGATSCFLASYYSVVVITLDLWNPAAVIHRRTRAADLAQRVIPLRADVTQVLPFAEDYFDAIFCMDAIHYFGADQGFFPHLLAHLKPDGRLVIGSPCFSHEFTSCQLAHLPGEYDDGTSLWPKEFSRYHSPAWWGDLIARTGLATVTACQELADGIVLWEDDTLDSLAHGQSEQSALRDAAQILYGHNHPDYPYLTHFILVAQKNPSQGVGPA